MAKVKINSGACGLSTTVKATMNGSKCSIEVESECEAIRALDEEFTQVDPFQEITFLGEGPATLAAGAEHCYHPACPVPVGIIKAVEVAAGLNLPVNSSINFVDDSE